ncbi:MAG TPA: hypothetical protein VL100_13160, partial [Croceibacterium sp.]|nr:hypothetical protein [Croceibacterium sp.]
MRLKWAAAFAATMLSAYAAYGTALAEETAPASGDWPRYARDLAATRFSPLDQIDASNVGRLEVAWTIPAGPKGM